VSLVSKGDFCELSGQDNITHSTGNKPRVIFKDINVKGANEVGIQIFNGILGSNGGITGGNSKNITVIIFGSLGEVYTTKPIGIMNLKENSSDILFISSCMYLVKLEFINGDKIRSSTVSYKVLIKN
jgi:predicted metal-binding protein